MMLRCLSIFILSLFLLGSLSAENPNEPSEKERKALRELESEIEGTILFTRNNRVYTVEIGNWQPKQIGEGQYARWSPDGKKIAVYSRRRVFVMDADGKNRKLLTDQAFDNDNCPIEFHTNGKEIIFLRRRHRGLWAVNIHDRSVRKIADFHEYSGEPGISADGRRLACRVGSDIYRIDLDENRDYRVIEGCSAGISPDGKWLMNNGDNGNRTHSRMNIRSWNGKKVIMLKAEICQPDGSWDNHHWSNHNDYICAQGDKRGESYVICLSKKRGTRVTWIGNTRYPDLYVSGDKKKRSGNAGSCSVNWIASTLALHLNTAVNEGRTRNPEVRTLNLKYDRTKSRIVVREVAKPSLANLDYAAYHRNVMFHDPTERTPHEKPGRQKLEALTFNGTLDSGSIRDRIEETPLSKVERARPISWEPFLDYLTDREPDLGDQLAEAEWSVEDECWKDDMIPVPYQTITEFYVHSDEMGRSELWAEIEFQPWVDFVDAKDDDKDHYREIYGRLSARYIGAGVFDIINEYRNKQLTHDQIIDWGMSLSAEWYDKYYTTFVENPTVFLQEKIEPEIARELDGLSLKGVLVVIRGEPRGKPLYTVIQVHSTD